MNVGFKIQVITWYCFNPHMKLWRRVKCSAVLIGKDKRSLTSIEVINIHLNEQASNKTAAEWFPVIKEQSHFLEEKSIIRAEKRKDGRTMALVVRSSQIQCAPPSREANHPPNQSQVSGRYGTCEMMLEWCLAMFVLCCALSVIVFMKNLAPQLSRDCNYRDFEIKCQLIWKSVSFARAGRLVTAGYNVEADASLECESMIFWEHFTVWADGVWSRTTATLTDYLPMDVKVSSALAHKENIVYKVRSTE